MRFRILTHNIQNGQPWNHEAPDDPRIDIEAVGRFLKAQNADILLLQEVERGHDGGMQIEPPPNYVRLQELLPGYFSVFAYPKRNETEIPFGLGLAIFSRTRLEDFERLDLPAAPLEFEFDGKRRRASERLLIQARTTLGGRHVRLMNSHLQAFFMIGVSSDEHPEQRNMVEERLRAETGPCILAGDMNSAPHEGLVAQFGRVGFRTVQNEETTWHRRPYVVDHIFYNADLMVVSKAVVHTDVSDHHAVVADFEFA
jgi:endonuclease/exonuclease/phosphatase family metal-dependent hydrolase